MKYHNFSHKLLELSDQPIRYNQTKLFPAIPHSFAAGEEFPTLVISLYSRLLPC